MADHAEPIGTASSSECAFPFQELPSAVQNKILRLVLQHHFEFSYATADTVGSLGGAPLAIALTCWELYTRSMKIFWGENLYNINLFHWKEESVIEFLGKTVSFLPCDLELLEDDLDIDSDEFAQLVSRDRGLIHPLRKRLMRGSSDDVPKRLTSLRNVPRAVLIRKVKFEYLGLYDGDGNKGYNGDMLCKFHGGQVFDWSAKFRILHMMESYRIGAKSPSDDRNVGKTQKDGGAAVSVILDQKSRDAGGMLLPKGPDHVELNFMRVGPWWAPHCERAVTCNGTMFPRDESQLDTIIKDWEPTGVFGVKRSLVLSNMPDGAFGNRLLQLTKQYLFDPTALPSAAVPATVTITDHHGAAMKEKSGELVRVGAFRRDGPFKFTGLSPELQTHILEHLLISKLPIMVYPPDLSLGQYGAEECTSLQEAMRKCGIYPEILSTSKKVHNLGLPVLYNKNQFFADEDVYYRFIMEETTVYKKETLKPMRTTRACVIRDIMWVDPSMMWPQFSTHQLTEWHKRMDFHIEKMAPFHDEVMKLTIRFNEERLEDFEGVMRLLRASPDMPNKAKPEVLWRCTEVEEGHRAQWSTGRRYNMKLGGLKVLELVFEGIFQDRYPNGGTAEEYEDVPLEEYSRFTRGLCPPRVMDLEKSLRTGSRLADLGFKVVYFKVTKPPDAEKKSEDGSEEDDQNGGSQQ